MVEGIKMYRRERRDILTRYEITDWRQAYLEKFRDRFTEYRRLWELTNKAAILTSYPIEIGFELSDRCNYSCEFCPRNSDFKKKLDLDLNKADVKFPFSAYKEIINEGRENNLFSVSFSTGAEALIKEDLIDFLNYARRNEIVDIRVTTNGFLLNEEKIKCLVDTETTFLGISIDAYKPQTYMKLRKHDLNRVINNIMNLIDYKQKIGKKFPIIRVSFVKTKENIDEMEDFLNFWSDKADIIDFQDFYTFEYCSLEEARRNNFFCAQPWQRANVWADGKLTLCCSWTAQKEAMGSVFEESVKNLWNSKLANAFRDSLTKKNYLDVCLWCVASNQKIINE